MLYILDLEPYKERYTQWWESYIPNKIAEYKINFQVIKGKSISNTVETGTVLDAAGTNYYKSTQLEQICQMFKNGDIKDKDHFLVCDIWFPGIEMIRYMSDLYKIKVYIWGVWHAGSITIGDFASVMNPWSKYFEMGFLSICNGVFVGSQYSRNSIIERLAADFFIYEKDLKKFSNKIIAYGMPLDYDYLQLYARKNLGLASNDVLKSEKYNRIVFPHRPDPEKGIDEFLSVIEILSEEPEFDSWTIAFCTSKEKYQSKDPNINKRLSYLRKRHSNIKVYENLEKEEYYTLVSDSKIIVSTTLEENFGYCLVEALALGTHPIVPNKYSHPEIINEPKCLYNNREEFIQLIKEAMINPLSEQTLKNYAKPFENVVHEWVGLMLNGLK